MAETSGRRYYRDDRRRVVNAGVRHGRDAADRGPAGGRRSRLITNITSTSLRPAASALSSFVTVLRPRSAARAISHRGARRRRDRLQRADRRRSSRSTLTTSTPRFEELDARYLAGEAADHAHTWSVIAAPRRDQPARTTRDDPRLGQRRPPAAQQRSRPVSLPPHPRRVGPRAGHPASTSRPCIG